MLHEPARHEPLGDFGWDERAAFRMIERIVRDTEKRFSPRSHWPRAPLDSDDGESGPLFNLYFGACGVVWSLHYLQALGAVRLLRSYADYAACLLPLNRAWLNAEGAADAEAASFLMGDTSVLLLGYWLHPTAEKAARLEDLIAGNVDHPSRELMWGAPGTMLAALFLHEWTREARWAELYVASARKLWSQLAWSPEHRCRHWVQDLYGQRSAFLGGVHGFAANAVPLIKGRHLMEPREWDAWQQCIVTTVRSTAMRENGTANWAPYVVPLERANAPRKILMQYCHGAPGVVICVADIPGRELDRELLAGGEAIWAAGPLTKGSNLCHGTGGNGYAFLKLHRRTGDPRWLDRARAFAMHGIAQTEADERRYGQMRYSLWTGDLGFAIYLWDCIRGGASFPTVDAFFAAMA